MLPSHRTPAGPPPLHPNPNPSSPMVQAAPNSPTPAPNADHPSPPSRLLSKHRPRRRAAPPRPPLLPLAPTRGQPDLTLCHCCGVRFPPPASGAKRLSVRPLRSLWRVVLLCGGCLSLVRSAAVCSYCLSLDNLPPENSSIACRSCNRCVHHYCIPAEHRTALIQPIDVENFVCVDCCPIVKPGSKNGGAASVPKLEAAARDPTSAARGKGETVAMAKVNAVRKAVEAKPASKCVKEALTLTGGGGKLERMGSGDPDLPDEELALQLHLAMNGSQRISLSGNASGGSPARQGKGHNGLIGGRNGSGSQGLCVTNMMDQLDDDETGAELGSNKNSKPVRQFDPSVTVVLALECVKGKHARQRVRGKRKGPPWIKQQNDVFNRYKKKYSKRCSSKQTKVENTERKTMPDGKDMDGDGGGNGIAPIK